MAYRKLNRDASARKALFRDLVTDLFINERIVTTEAKAKELRSIAEELITLAKRGDLHARRQAASFVRREKVSVKAEENETALTTATSKDKESDKKAKENKVEKQQDALQKLFGEIADSYKERNGGYTRVLKLGPRRGDAAPMAVIELVK